MWYGSAVTHARDKLEDAYITKDAEKTSADDKNKCADAHIAYRNVHGDLIRTCTAIMVEGVPLGIIERESKTLYMLCEKCSPWVEERKGVVRKYINKQGLEIDNELPATYDELMDMMGDYIGVVYVPCRCHEPTCFDDYDTGDEERHFHNRDLDKAVDEAGGWEKYKRLKGITTI